MQIGIPAILGIVFVILKLCGVIAWSWWWVTCPFWGGLALIAAFYLIVGVLKLTINGIGLLKKFGSKQ